MEILSAISDGTRIIPCIISLVHQSNPYLQSKAVLMIGRINRNIKWVLNRLNDADARVRANAVEALWGVDTEEVRSALRAAARDKNNRVAGNALLALYQLGDCWAIPEITAMASHESARFRSTAAWVMGKTGDSRFSRVLARLVGEPGLTVRSRAFSALAQIKAAAVQSRQGNEWMVVARSQTGQSGGRREINVTVCSKDGQEQVELLPTQFILTEGAHTVTNYSTEGRKAPGALAVAFVYPRCTAPAHAPFNQGALEALQGRRHGSLGGCAVSSRSRPECRGDASVAEDCHSNRLEFAPRGPSAPVQLRCRFYRGRLFETRPRMDSPTWEYGSTSGSVEERARPGQCYLIVDSQGEDSQPAGYWRSLASSPLASQTVRACDSVGP